MLIGPLVAEWVACEQQTVPSADHFFSATTDDVADRAVTLGRRPCRKKAGGEAITAGQAWECQGICKTKIPILNELRGSALPARPPDPGLTRPAVSPRTFRSPAVRSAARSPPYAAPARTGRPARSWPPGTHGIARLTAATTAPARDPVPGPRSIAGRGHLEFRSSLTATPGAGRTTGRAPPPGRPCAAHRAGPRGKALDAVEQVVLRSGARAGKASSALPRSRCNRTVSGEPTCRLNSRWW